MSARVKRTSIGCAVILCLLAAVMFWVRSLLPSYPYGYSHCCLKGLGLALWSYAEAHDGHFPAGAGCPEASLSLLYRWDRVQGDPEVLRGKTVPLETVTKTLERGELLGPDTCGWHYVDGLTLADNPKLAIVWDKVGLGHNGQDIGGGHSVWFLGGPDEVVPASQWPQFLKRQEQLMAARSEAAKKGLPALTAKVRLPSGEVVDRYDGRVTTDITYTSSGGSSTTSHSSSTELAPGALRWWRLNDGVTVLTLSLDDCMFEPVRVEVSNGKARPDSIIFEMKMPDKPQTQGPASPDHAR